MHIEPANRATGWEVEPMTAIAKIVLIVILAVGALGLAGCKRHRFRRGRDCRIDVVDHDRYDTRGVDVHVYRPQPRYYDRHDDHRRRY